MASQSSAAQPDLRRIDPIGFQRGTEVDVTITGNRLDDARQILFYSPGVEVVSLTPEKTNVVKAKFKVAEDCRLGLHAFRVVTASGVSDLRMFAVGAMANVEEIEPNSEFDTPQETILGVTVIGKVDNEDVDFYVVEAKKGQRISAELEGLRLGYTFFDPYIAILDSKRFELARCDDASLLRQDAVCSVVAPEDGRYIIEVRECAYGGDGNSLYRLHIGSFPRPTAVYPAGAKPGETVKVRWIGDPSGSWEQQVAIPAEAKGDYGLFAEDDHGVSPSPNRIRVNGLENALEQEPNDTRETGSPAVIPGAFNGIIEKAGDVDHFKFTAKKGQRVLFKVIARETIRSPLDSVIVVRKMDGTSLGSNDDQGGPDSQQEVTFPEDGEYVLQIYDHLKSGGENYVYRVEVEERTPELTLSLPERERYISTVLNVPQGNRMALMFNAARANFGSDLEFMFENLPPGITVETFPMAENRNELPVIFVAAADAQPSGSLTNVKAKATKEGVNVEGGLLQRSMLVRGQNNRDVWGHDADRMAAALTEKIPFRLEIVQPQSPILRDGSKQLKVVAHRDEGFDAEIAVRLLYNPPGIGSSGSIKIEKGATEATIPLTANGNASIGKWPIVVVGTAAGSNGTIEASTPFAEIEVADHIFAFDFQKAAAELGQSVPFTIGVTKKSEFAGEAKFELLGLPAKTSTEPVMLTAENPAAVFTVKIEEDARPGRYQNLVCRATVTINGEQVDQTLGSGEIRVDKPLPPKVDAPKPEPMAEQPKPEPKPEPQAKPLSRLEQLRLERLKQLEGKE